MDSWCLRNQQHRGWEDYETTHIMKESRSETFKSLVNNNVTSLKSVKGVTTLLLVHHKQWWNCSRCTSTFWMAFPLLCFPQVQTWWSVMKVTSWRMRRLLCPKRWTPSGREGGWCWRERLCRTTSLNVSLPVWVEHFDQRILWDFWMWNVWSLCPYQTTAWWTSSRRTCLVQWKSSGTASLTPSRTVSVPTPHYKMSGSWRRGLTSSMRCWTAVSR